MYDSLFRERDVIFEERQDPIYLYMLSINLHKYTTFFCTNDADWCIEYSYCVAVGDVSICASSTGILGRKTPIPSDNNGSHFLDFPKRSKDNVIMISYN